MFKVTLIFLMAMAGWGQQGPAGQLGCYGDPVCPNCGPGQCVVSNGGHLIGPGDYAKQHNPPCAQQLDDDVKSVKSTFDAAAKAGLTAWVGPQGAAVYNAVGNNFLRELVRLGDRRSACLLTAVQAPPGSKLDRVVLWWSEGNGTHHIVPPDTDLHFARWERLSVTTNDAGVFSSAVFKNWSHNLTRTATMHILYRPANWSDRYVQENPPSANGTVWDPKKGGPR